MKTKIAMSPFTESQDIHRGPVICLTDFCNMSCSYCSRDCGPNKRTHLPIQKVKEVIDFFSAKESTGSKYAQFTGGEIFVYPDIFTAIEYALEKGFICRLQTNGTLLKKVAKMRPDILSNPSVIIKVSLDGWDEETNKCYRGEGTFSATVKGIEAALQINPNVGIKTVIHEKNFTELEKMLDLCISLGVKGWSYNTLMLRGRETHGTLVTELAVAKRLIKKYNQTKYCHLLNGSNIQGYHWMNFQGIKSLPPYFFVMNNGEVYVTDRLVPERKTGTVFATDLENQFDARDVLSRID